LLLLARARVRLAATSSPQTSATPSALAAFLAPLGQDTGAAHVLSAWVVGEKVWKPRSDFIPFARRRALHEALALLDRGEAIQGLAPSSALWQDRADYRKQLGDEAGTRAARKRAEGLPPVGAPDHYLLATTYAGKLQYAAAVAELNKALKKKPRHYWSWFQRGLCYQEQGKYALALGDFSACIALWPDFAWGYFNRGRILQQLGKNEEACRDYSMALRLDRELVHAHLNRGLVHLELGHYQPALADFSAAARGELNSVVVHGGRGIALEYLGQHRAADAAFARAWKCDPNHVAMLLGYGFAVAERLPARASMAFSKVLQREPRNHRALYGLGMLFSNRSPGSDQALFFFNQAVEGMQFHVKETPFEDCLNGGQGLYRDLSGEKTADPVASPLLHRLAAHGATCFFAAPLRAGDRTIGILQCVCTRPTSLSGEQIQLLYLVADLLGPAISNCRLYERLRATYEELRAAQEQLIRVEKMRALGELASGMAHDFNNSLCGVLGFLDLTLFDKTLSSGCRTYLESARTCALDAAQTVRRVQDFAGWRRHDPVFETLDLNDLLRQIVVLTRHRWEGLARTGRAAIAVTLRAEATAKVLGNAGELREVLTNLVFNAVDAMPDGGTLTLRSWTVRGDVFLSVGDTGVGMSQAVRQRLFEPFFTTKGERGNGMGLSVAFGIVQSHGGEINVVSELHLGTTFTIRLPAADKEKGNPEAPDLISSGERATGMVAGTSGEEVPAPPEGAAGSGDPRRALGGLRILVVEDEENIRHYLETVFLQLGHYPILAADAAAALAAFSQERFDLVFTDLGLPDMSGEELVRQLIKQTPDIPVVFLTGCPDQVKSGDKAGGAVRILAKPVTISNLVETLDAFRLTK
jgi:signal transduction histidine kinase/Tfp pilus assembly protein PilF